MAPAADADVAAGVLLLLLAPGTSRSNMESTLSPPAATAPVARGREVALGPAEGTSGVDEAIAAPAGTAALRPVRAGDFFLAGEGPRADETRAPPGAGANSCGGLVSPGASTSSSASPKTGGILAGSGAGGFSAAAAAA